MSFIFGSSTDVGSAVFEAGLPEPKLLLGYQDQDFQTLKCSLHWVIGSEILCFSCMYSTDFQLPALSYNFARRNQTSDLTCFEWTILCAPAPGFVIGGPSIYNFHHIVQVSVITRGQPCHCLLVTHLQYRRSKPVYE